MPFERFGYLVLEQREMVCQHVVKKSRDSHLVASNYMKHFLYAVVVFLADIYLLAEPCRYIGWKSHATLTLLAKQDLPTFGYNMIDPLKSWCWGSILFYPFKISRFS